MLEDHVIQQLRRVMPSKGIPLNIDDLCKACVSVTREIVANVIGQANGDPETAFEEHALGRRMKKCLGIDSYAEQQCSTLIRKILHGQGKKWHFFGEEKLRNPSLDLSHANNICVLADAVDGTDLLERDLSNWCSTFAVFDPRCAAGQKLLASFVGTPNKDIYYARSDLPGAYFVAASTTTPIPVTGPSEVKSLKEASICFYGQKVSNLYKTMKTGFLDSINQAITSSDKKATDHTLRVYNLAGIPMMVRLAHNTYRGARRIDAVFDVAGQMPHDVVPGAFIAKKAGAVILGLDGKEITYEILEDHLMRPAQSRMKYVLAATPELASELISGLNVHTD
jgi:fructose-1,6-bisphosphatase/inositol monophosphatase family enzyme